MTALVNATARGHLFELGCPSDQSTLEEWGDAQSVQGMVRVWHQPRQAAFDFPKIIKEAVAWAKARKKQGSVLMQKKSKPTFMGSAQLAGNKGVVEIYRGEPKAEGRSRPSRILVGTAPRAPGVARNRH